MESQSPRHQLQSTQPVMHLANLSGDSPWKKARNGDNGFAPSLSSTLQDPERNKIFQWLEVTSKHGIAQLSFPLIPEPILGSYQIIVERKSGEKEYQPFRVEEYGKQKLINYQC